MGADGEHINSTDDIEVKGKLLEHTMSIAAPTNAGGGCAMSVPLSAFKTTSMSFGSMFQAPVGADKLFYELELAGLWKEKWAPFLVKFILV